MNKTMIRTDLTEAVHFQLGLSRNESAQLVESVLEEIAMALESGDSVKLSSFGTFTVHHKAERFGRNPKTGVEARITPRRILSFRPSNLMKQRVNQG